MNINFTLVGQLFFFACFVVFCMKFVWPPIIAALQERAEKIAEGLSAAEKANKDLEVAKLKAEDEIGAAKAQGAEIVDSAKKRADQMVEEAKAKAQEEAQRIIAGAEAEIEQQVSQTREALRGQVAALALAGAEKILESSVDASKHSEMLEKLAAEL